MATHYNEPVDIASSSLTEDGTVFGGEKNLIKGLDNLIKLYNPKVIGVSTTCLAETIGEDISKIVHDYMAEREGVQTKIITVPAAGYAGSQYEGYFKAQRAIVEQSVLPSPKNGKINIVTGILSPADTRFIKTLLKEMGIEYILLTDLSGNLDGGYERNYSRLSKYGTDIEDISAMGGSELTIELSTFIKDEYSPGIYLKDNFGVPLKRLNLPIGLRDTDEFISALSAAGGKASANLIEERGRYLDAMADSHKYNSEARCAVFGEPDFVYSVCRLLSENGAFTAIAATGSDCKPFIEAVKQETAAGGGFHFNEETLIFDETDFAMIESRLKEKEVNLLVGSSDGRRMEEKHNIPLVRCAFPIHDHVGGQRVRTLGYEGSITLLDRVTNALLSVTEQSFRGLLFNAHYPSNSLERGQGDMLSDGTTPSFSKLRFLKSTPPQRGITLAAQEKTKTHPCFNGCASGYARMHLPVAMNCNIKCNYCVRKYDCPNESRPGITSRVVTPIEALEKYLSAKEKFPNLTVAAIAGPGDALADFEKTRETLSLIREADSDVTFCLSTNGLLLPYYADELFNLGVSHVTVTMNAVNPSIGAMIYEKINFMGESYSGETGAALLLANQLAGISRLKALGMVCKVNTVMLKGVNDAHIAAVAEKARELGADILNIMQLVPVRGSAFENTPLVSNMEIQEMRKSCGEILPQMYHCRQCRADAIGTLDKDMSGIFWAEDKTEESAEGGVALRAETPILFAVSSKDGILVDQHFGHTEEFYIYEYNGSEARFKEKRSVYKYCEGKSGCDNQEDKMNFIINAISGCSCVLTMRIGENPKARLNGMGIKTFITYDRIESAVMEAAKYCSGKGAGPLPNSPPDLSSFANVHEGLPRV
jgi:nitrogenase molybdenum-iron protein alpha/beta subunit/MoaA/NifB/PqqE/SkfB family radical SAM enzyme